MINKIQIQNFKSIKNISLNLGRINVFIGENGAGKSNILEAIALVGAASANKLDNEFLASRGIRVTSPHLMRQAFDESSNHNAIEISISNELEAKKYSIQNDNQPYSKWESIEKFTEFSTVVNFGNLESSKKSFDDFFKHSTTFRKHKQVDEFVKLSHQYMKVLQKTLVDLEGVVDELEKETKIPKEEGLYSIRDLNTRVNNTFTLPKRSNVVLDRFRSSFSTINKEIADFLIFSPENSALKLLEKEGQIEPLGINGEGLLKFITVLSELHKDDFLKIKDNLKLLGWFEDIEFSEDKSSNNLKLKDKYISKKDSFLEQLSANEGFLFLLFYFSLFCSRITPKFFAIDNIDSSLNPKLCEQLIKEVSKLSVQYDKQVILTTHNPSVLDGLNLQDDDQRLFVITRSDEGYTKVRQIKKPQSTKAPLQRMSQLFLNGALGGIPKGF